eukprot:COSAG01_NODE_862_length_13058_cov_6.823366_5_plen_48_part_00
MYLLVVAPQLDTHYTQMRSAQNAPASTQIPQVWYSRTGIRTHPPTLP